MIFLALKTIRHLSPDRPPLGLSRVKDRSSETSILRLQHFILERVTDSDQA
jgi:hypothetical protein